MSVICEAVDNTTAEHSAHANRSKSRELHMSRTLSRRALSLARLGITSTTMRVSTKQNLFADLLSRGAVEEFLWAARQCGFEPIRLAIPGAAIKVDPLPHCLRFVACCTTHVRSCLGCFQQVLVSVDRTCSHMVTVTVFNITHTSSVKPGVGNSGRILVILV